MRHPSRMAHLPVQVQVLLRVSRACIQAPHLPTTDGLLCNSVILGRAVSHLRMDRLLHVSLLK